MKIRGFEKTVDAPEKVQLPARSTEHSAGYDFFTADDVNIPPGMTASIKTHVKAYMQPNEVLLVFPRSSIGIKRDMRLMNCVGVIDADYYSNATNDGNIIVNYKNEGIEYQIIKAGDKIAQGIFVPFLLADNDDDVKKDVRTGGIGSTDKKE